MKEIDVLGVKIKECSLRESLKYSDGYLRNGALNTVVYLSSKLLVNAGSNEEHKAWIEDTDLTIFGDASVLKNATDAPDHRIEEIEKDIYLREFLKKIVRMHRSVVLLSDTPEHMETLRKEVTDYQAGLNIITEHVMSEHGEDPENLWNKLNDIAPSVIISRIDYGLQAGMMMEARKFLNADIWIGLLDAPAGKNIKNSKLSGIVRAFYRMIFYFDFRKKKNKEES